MKKYLVDLEFEISASMESLELLLLEQYSFDKRTVPLRMEEGNWKIDWKEFPLEEDRLVDFMLVGKGERGRDCILKIKVSDYELRKGGYTNEQKFNKKGWVSFTGTINLQ